jgi:hypothetical protein
MVTIYVKREGMLTRRSADASKELVASSSAKIAGFLSRARAMARRWRWPPLRLNRLTERVIAVKARKGIPPVQDLTVRIKPVRQTPYEFAICFASSSLDLLPGNVLVAIGDI